MKTDLEDRPQVILSKRADQVFKKARSVEGKSIEEFYMRIGAKPGGCSDWEYELEWNAPEDIRS